MSYNFGTNALVTGSNRGIGLSLVQQLTKIDGIKHIFAGCRNPENANELLELQKAHPNVILLKLDVQDDQTIESSYEQVVKVLGDKPLNLLINNAGVLEKEGGSFDHPDRKAFQKTFDINSTSVVLLTAKFLPLLQKAVEQNQRAIVANISSEGGSSEKAHKVPFHVVCYGMSKSALNYYTKMMSVHLADSGIIFVSFCPGWVKTDMGGPNAILEPEESTSTLLKTISGLKNEDSGRYLNRNGETIPY